VTHAFRPTTIAELFGPNPPSNWGRWGPDDEVGSLNYLDAAQVLRGVGAVVTGETFTLQVEIGSERAATDPVWPNRTSAVRTAVMDEGYFQRGEAPEPRGGHHYADDRIEMFLQGSTQYDALGHLWYDGQIWNGYDAATTVGKLRRASVLPIAQRGVVGHGVLIDVARHRGKRWLERAEPITLADLLDAAQAQGCRIDKRDVLVIRTGWLGRFYAVPPEEFYAEWNEPGLAYSPELVEWFQAMEIPNLVTDTIANEQSFDPETGIEMRLHCALMRNLGIAMTEICWLDDLADACARDGRWTFMYSAAPLKVVGASGAPVNPVVIR
jgi:kynurenine formamidase